MSDNIEALQRRIAELKCQLREWEALTIQRVHQDSPNAEQSSPTVVVAPQGKVDNQGYIDGVAVGINLGTIIYGRTPKEDERRQLVWYLDRLANKLYQLPLRALEQRLDQGKGMALPHVYVMLATMSQFTIPIDTQDLPPLFRKNNPTQPLKEEYSSEYALPYKAILAIDPLPYQDQESSIKYSLSYALLATTAVSRQQRLVVLGDPGSGKSTFLRHLAWALAQRGLDQQDKVPMLIGWEETRQTTPVMLSLRTLAGRLAQQGVSNETVYTALLDEIQSYHIGDATGMLNAALHCGALLLLFDGLDEVPLEEVPDQVVDRATTLCAVHDFMQLHAKCSSVISCRTRAFDTSLREALGWPIETIAPFTLGQIRHFVPAWYQELVLFGELDAPQAERISKLLLDTILATPKLQAMAQTPLLLTMIALVAYNKGELPRDRPQLYERILELLLGQWDKVRNGLSLAEAIGKPDWGSERIRPLLDQLSFLAHAQATSSDGWGRLARRDVRDALENYLQQAGLSSAQAAASAVRCLEYFNQRSGLLIPDNAQDSYTFAHLTLQEHCAGRALMLDLDAARLVMRYRTDDRWREPITLGLGVVQRTNPALIDRVLSDLIDPDEQNQPKTAERWQRDLIFAAEIGHDRDWHYLRSQRINVDRLQRDLRRGLAALLQDKAQPLPVAERIQAGFLLGDLGDPRFPVTLDEWRRELDRARTGDRSGYFCRVEAGTYIVGSADDDLSAYEDEMPQHTLTIAEPFWIGRFPITNVQWQYWVEQGAGTPSFYADHQQFNGPNQPVVGVTWHKSNEFCAWLAQQTNAVIRLPNEFEWEAAARGGDARRYPWGDDWREDHAASKESQQHHTVGYSVPVGCFPIGAAPNGVLDMVGNVFEWTSSDWRSYPGAAKPFANMVVRVLRGRGWGDTKKLLRCSARSKDRPAYSSGSGFRIVMTFPLR